MDVSSLKGPILRATWVEILGSTLGLPIYGTAKMRNHVQSNCKIRLGVDT